MRRKSFAGPLLLLLLGGFFLWNNLRPDIPMFDTAGLHVDAVVDLALR